MPRIFVSYRREDTAGYSGRLYDDLEEVFGDDVFRDIDTLEGGQRYGDRINEAVANCDAFLAVIGDSWLEITDRQGKRRIDKADDWVRLELRAAFEHGVKVIPVLVGKAEMPVATELPADVRQLVDLQAREVRDAAWDYGVDTLVSDLGGRAPWHRVRIPLGIAAVAVVVAGVLLVSGGGGDAPPTTAASAPCPPGVTTNAYASCEFATAVANAYPSAGTPRRLEGVASPRTGYEYDLECSTGARVVCTTVDSTDPDYDQDRAAQIRIN